MLSFHSTHESMKKTIVLRVDPQKPEADKIRIAADLIRNGGTVAFPTETVYGLGADALNPRAVLSLFRAKRRPLDNPPIVHVSSITDVHKLAKQVPAEAVKLMREFWPGPLTLIFKRSGIVPSVTVAGLDTVAVRMPRHNVALALITESGCVIAAPSANLAGRPSPTSAEHVLEDLNGRIDAILDAGPTQVGLESTVLDLTSSPPQVLRPGGIPFEALKRAMRKVELNTVVIAEKPVQVDKARSPGMKHKHYAPKAEVVVVEGELSAVVRKINELVEYCRAQAKRVGVLATEETASCYAADVVKSLGSRNDLGEVASNLFRLLREFDLDGVDVIIAEGVPMEGMGLAVMNRLRKASGYHIVKARRTNS